MLKQNTFNIGFIFLIILEHLFLLFFHSRQITSQSVNAVGYFTTSLLFGLLVIVKFYNKGPLSEGNLTLGNKKYFLYFLYAAVLVVLNVLMIPVIKNWSCETMSDIILTIRVLVQRFLEGLNPYDPTAYARFGHHVAPGYLTMHWLPYCIAEKFHFDYRTITFSIWAVGAFIVMHRSMQCTKLWLRLFVPMIFLLSYIFILNTDQGIIAITVEMMVAGYYMLFLSNLNHKNPLVVGFFISVCLLSRYYILLWLPLWAFVLLVSGKKMYFIKAASAILLSISILYILPFLSRDWGTFYASAKAYQILPLGEWYHLNNNGLPASLYDGTGFACFFYERYKATNADTGYFIIRNVLFISTVGSTILMSLWFWFNRLNIDYRIFLLASVKIYMTLFFTFVVVPYKYLMLTNLFITIAIFTEQARYNADKRNVV